MRNSISCHVVADYFLLQVDPTEGDTISNLKLQKLCYYAQAWSLALRDSPLFTDRIEAWAHGPVVPPLYGRFKHYGWQSIDPTQLQTDPLSMLADDDVQFLAMVWSKYGKLSGKQLEVLTHSETPWRTAYGDTPPGGRCDAEITHDAMRLYYRAQVACHDGNSRTEVT